MSAAPSKLPPFPSPELQRRPVLRPAGNTSLTARGKGSIPASKPAWIAPVPSHYSSSPAASPITPQDDGCFSPSAPENAEENTTCSAQDKNAEVLRTTDTKSGGEARHCNAILQVSQAVGKTKTPKCKNLLSPPSLEKRCARQQQQSPGSALAAQKVRTNITQQRRESLARSRQHQSKPGRIVPDALPAYAAVEDLKKRCGWITSQSGPASVAYHDTEWGVPVHDDRKLFEMFVLVGAQAEISWPTILERREVYRSAFAGFDPAVVAKFDDERLVSLRANGSIMLHEGKLRGVIENAIQVLKVVEEFGSFDRYLWGFVNNKMIVSKHRLPKQVPVKSPKSELISRDMIKRGFRFVGPTIMYSFMQAVGMVNDHLVTCFRYGECNSPPPRQQLQKCLGDRIPEEGPSEEDMTHSVGHLYGD